MSLYLNIYYTSLLHFKHTSYPLLKSSFNVHSFVSKLFFAFEVVLKDDGGVVGRESKNRVACE